MKVTMQIDADLLHRVMVAAGASSKTHAVNIALREFDRRSALARVAGEGLGLSPDGLREAIREEATPVPHGRRTRSRR